MKELTNATLLVPFNGGWLALTYTQFDEAWTRGQEIIITQSNHEIVKEDKILDADGMYKTTGVPASWFLEAARRGDIPCLQFGKYKRFRLREVFESLQSQGRHTDKLSVAPKKRAVHQ